FKNLWDWMSRIDTPKIWRDKPMFLLSASPTRRKESFVIKLAKDLFPYFGAQIIAEFFLYSFNHTFKDDGIIDEELWQAFDIQLEKFQSHLDKL
ncbi:MAG: NAD(P)H-dependent oxidoreductase, partial [Bacteroidota bacterium]